MFLIAGCAQEIEVTPEPETYEDKDIIIELGFGNAHAGTSEEYLIFDDRTVKVSKKDWRALEEVEYEKQISKEELLELTKFITDKEFFTKSFERNDKVVMDTNRYTLKANIDDKTREVRWGGDEVTNEEVLMAIIAEIEEVSKE